MEKVDFAHKVIFFLVMCFFATASYNSFREFFINTMRANKYLPMVIFWLTILAVLFLTFKV